MSSITLRLGAYEAGEGSFDLDFKGFTFVTDTPSPTEPGKSEPTNSSAPAIHLDLQANVGSTVSGSSALIEGQGLQRSSAYALRLGPSGQVLETGTVSRGGGFSDAISLPPGLAPGQYFIELSAVGADGQILVLRQYFSVGADGTFTSIDPAGPGAGSHSSLAATGSSDNAGLAAFSSLGLLLAGLSLMVSARWRASRLSRTR